MGGTVVPGQTMGTTPPTFGGGGVSTQPTQTNEQVQKILQMLAQSAQQKQFAGKPFPVSVPGQQDTTPPSYMTNNANPHAWGAQRFMYTLGKTMQNAAAKFKEKQVMEAESDFEYLQSGLNELYSAQATGDQQRIQTAQQKVDAFMADPKRLKNMAKALNQDWLNPEKTTPWTEGLKRVAAKTQQKQQAATGLRAMVQKLLQRKQQPQMSDADKQKMAHEIQGKAPITQGTMSLANLKDMVDIEKASAELRDKYQYITGMDGKVWAVNKQNPRDTHVLKDADSGEDVTGKTTGKNGPLMANGLPIGVYHNGVPVMPGAPGWTAQDQQMYEGALGAAQEKQNLRVDPIIAAQVGNPPDPKDFPKGRSDPKYAEALATWGKSAEAIKERQAGASGTARAIAFNQYRPVQVMDDDGNVYYTTAAAAIAKGQAGAGEGVKLKPREAQINDIQVASGRMRDAINGLEGTEFTPEQIAKLHYALETDDPSLANSELSALASEDLSDKQQDFVIWVRQLNERAMSLRNVAGMGTGAQDLRTAIRAMIPGIKSGSKGMMLKQLDAFDNQVRILKGGIAHPGKIPAKTTDQSTPPTGAKIRDYTQLGPG